jgi:hypothetical protein
VKNEKKAGPPTRIPLVRGTIVYPFMEMELEYEGEIETPLSPRDAKNDIVVLRPGKIAEITMEMVDLTGDDATAQAKPPAHPARKNGKPKPARAKARKKPARRGKS